jgi:hypothetical protein
VYEIPRTLISFGEMTRMQAVLRPQQSVRQPIQESALLQQRKRRNSMGRNGEGVNACRICFGEISNIEGRAMMVTVCGHIFHLVCWNTYIKLPNSMILSAGSKVMVCPRCHACSHD